MANKKVKKQVKKATKKAAKKYPKVFIALVVIVALAIVVLWILDRVHVITIPFLHPEEKTEQYAPHTGEDGYVEDIVYDDFQIHFMMLGNDKAGDSVYIKAGDTDILIDAGSRSASSSTTIPYMQNYVKDNKLEYVIATHGDQDHIEAFPKILESFDAGIIIRNQYSNKTTAGYTKMLQAFQSQVDNKGAKSYFASQCFDEESGAKRVYQLSDNVTMEIIYNYYYWNKAKDENDYSVCTMFTYNCNEDTKHFFFTGDLEKDGEEKLVEYYDASTKEKTLPTVDLFKAGHHGSKTSSNDCLLNIIQPKMCVVSCCCGTDEYTGATDNQFPTQAFISRIAKWTDRVYVTSIYESFEIVTAKETKNSKGESVSDKTGVAIGGEYIHSTGFKAMNGNVVVSCNGINVGIWASNNLTKLKDSEWFNTTIIIDGKERKMRTWPQ